MKNITLNDFTNEEMEWLGEMIAEKLAEMGHENVTGFAFCIDVDFAVEGDNT